jgi:hypothetical protein
MTMEDFQTRCLQRQTWVSEEWRDGRGRLVANMGRAQVGPPWPGGSFCNCTRPEPVGVAQLG